jgi:hypothetical protein
MITFEEWEARKMSGDPAGQNGIYDTVVAV